MYQGETNGRSALSVFVRVPVARGGVHCALQRFLRHAVTLLDGLARGGGAYSASRFTCSSSAPRLDGAQGTAAQTAATARRTRAAVQLDRGGVGPHCCAVGGALAAATELLDRLRCDSGWCI
ncbi:hypothetical protein TcYC6_0026540 [Trypanosoma cruzi]|nr:hypothetical protein TcYC6_0026540 [Trypanosoma cruzi]